jgi:serine/threonine protein kinase
MSPELLKGQRYSFPADVWAAGCVLFELMCRKHAFTGSSREELFGNIIGGQIPQMPTQYSKDLTDLLKSMLAQDPTKRPTCKEILGSAIIGQGLEVLQTKLSKYFGQPTSPKTQAAPKRPQQKEATPGEDTDSEIDQAAIPEWLIDNRGVREELVRQSNRHLEKDNYRLLGVIRSSIKSLAPAVRGAGPPLGITGNLTERKRRLEEEARRALGDKYDLAYRFITKFGQEKRADLLSQMGISAGGKIPELELRMIETLTAIEACE